MMGPAGQFLGPRQTLFVNPGILVLAQPAVSGNENGDFVVVWLAELWGGNDRRILAQRFGRDGARSGPPLTVASGIAEDRVAPSVTMRSNGSALVVWGQRNKGKPGRCHGQPWDDVFARVLPANDENPRPAVRVSTHTDATTCSRG
jgi:hypothetical protein